MKRKRSNNKEHFRNDTSEILNPLGLLKLLFCNRSNQTWSSLWAKGRSRCPAPFAYDRFRPPPPRHPQIGTESVHELPIGSPQRSRTIRSPLTGCVSHYCDEAALATCACVRQRQRPIAHMQGESATSYRRKVKADKAPASLVASFSSSSSLLGTARKSVLSSRTTKCICLSILHTTCQLNHGPQCHHHSHQLVLECYPLLIYSSRRRASGLSCYYA